MFYQPRLADSRKEIKCNKMRSNGKIVDRYANLWVINFFMARQPFVIRPMKQMCQIMVY